MTEDGAGMRLREPPPAPASVADGPPGHRLPSFLRGRPSEARSRWAVALWIATVVIIATASVVVAAAAGARLWHQPTFSGFDEQAHLDYAIRLSHGELPRWGDRYTPETVGALNCLGIARTVPQPCITNGDPRRYPPDGYSYEAQQPPLGYLAYVPFLRPHASPGAALAAARRGGLAWLALAAVLLIAMSWMADSTVAQTTLILTVCLVNPMAFQAAATVTNDSAALAAGAASVVVIQYLRRRRCRPVAAVSAAFAVGVLVGLTKALFIIAPLALLAGGLLLERPRKGSWSLQGFWRRHAATIGLMGGAAVSAVGFVLYQDARASVAPSVVLHALLGGQTTRLPRWSTLEISVQHVFSAFTAYVPVTLLPLYTVWSALVHGSATGLVLNRSNGGQRALRALAGGTFIAAMALSLGFPLLDYFQGHFNYIAPSRYLIPLLPLLGYIVARTLRPRALLLVGVVAPALALGSTLFGPI